MIDLHDIGKYKENNRLEAKQGIGGFPRSLWDTYSSFANTFGGIILIGVEETHNKELRVLGLAYPEERLEEFWTTINDRSYVSVNILRKDQAYIAEIEGKSIVVIEVPRADRHYRPVYLGSDPYSGTYRRNGDGDYRCSAEEVNNMIRDKGDIDADAALLTSFSCDVFCRDSIRNFRSRMRNLHPGHPLETLGDGDFLVAIQAAGFDHKTRRLHPTIAGLLVFGYEEYIVRQFPNYFLDYRDEMNKKQEVSDRVVSNSGDWSGNLFDFYFKVYKRIVQGIKPAHVPSGSEWVRGSVHDALREALANAVLHTNYYDRQGLVIHKRKNAVVISNPGCLRVTTSDLNGRGVPDPRNAVLTKIFALVNVGDRAGTGIPGIKAVWSRQGWIAPRFEESFGPDRVTVSLPLERSACTRLSRADRSMAIRKVILDYLLDNVEASIPRLALQIKRGILYTALYVCKLEKEDVLECGRVFPLPRYRLKN